VAAHSKSVSSDRMIRGSGWALESRPHRCLSTGKTEQPAFPRLSPNRTCCGHAKIDAFDPNRTFEQIYYRINLVWSGLVWSGLVWSGLFCGAERFDFRGESKIEFNLWTSG
jgi:hypothetical protein